VAASSLRRGAARRRSVARFLLGIAAKHPTAAYEPVVHGDGEAFWCVSRVRSTVVSFATDGERVTEIWVVRNPEKLRLW
jgi:RNA polymerase sigma-70 factor (ECF subfamily)